MEGYKRKIIDGNTSEELTNKINEFEETNEITDMDVKVYDSNNSKSGYKFIANIVYATFQ